MIIDCVSDLHGFYPKLEGGDLLIVAGDLTAKHTPEEFSEFYIWLERQKYTKKVVIAGNHDTEIEGGLDLDFPEDGIHYLQDCGMEFQGMKIWGSPWTKTFEGMNPKCKAFTVDTEDELSSKFSLIPEDVDILITHSPPHRLFDKIPCNKTNKIISVGSIALKDIILRRGRISLHVFGHIHEGYGIAEDKYEGISVNASYVNEHYKPVNKPVRVVL